MRLDHLLSKETSRGWITVLVPKADCADVKFDCRRKLACVRKENETAAFEAEDP